MFSRFLLPKEEMYAHDITACMYVFPFSIGCADRFPLNLVWTLYHWRPLNFIYNFDFMQWITASQMQFYRAIVTIAKCGWWKAMPHDHSVNSFSQCWAPCFSGHSDTAECYNPGCRQLSLCSHQLYHGSDCGITFQYYIAGCISWATKSSPLS